VGQAVVEGVALDVGLVDDVQAVLVAQVVPAGVVGVVAGAHGIEVELLHQPDVGDHALQGDGLAAPVVMLVAVDALEQHRLAVDQQGAPPDFHAPEADAQPPGVYRPAPGVMQGDDQRVQVRRLRRPLARGGDGRRQVSLEDRVVVRHDRLADRGGEQRRAVRIEEGHADAAARRAGPGGHADPGADAQRPVAEVVVQLRPGEDVGQVDVRHAVEVHIAVDAGHPPVILIFQVAAIRPADDHGRQRVLARLEEGRNVEFSGQARVLAVAGLMAVDPDVEGAFHALKGQDHPPPGPARREREGGAVEAGRVVVVRDARRIVGDGHLDVGVDRPVVALHRPVGGDVDRPPVAGVIAGLAEPLRRGLRVGGQMKAPAPVEGLIVGGILALPVAQGRRLIGERDQRRAGGQAVVRGDLRVFPVGDVLHVTG